MTCFRTLLTAAAVTLGLVWVAPAAKAGSFEHIDELAGELQGFSSKLSREFRDHYRHTPQYRHLTADARKLRTLANHIHEVAHEGNLEHLHDDLHDLEELLHHVDGLVDEIEHEAEHGGGHTHGDTRHVRRILKDMDGTLHHMLEDVEEMTGGARIERGFGGEEAGHEDHGHEEHGQEDHGHAEAGHEDHDHGQGGGISVRSGSGRTVIRFGFGR